MIDNELTHHAKSRMAERRIPEHAVEAAISYGREIHTRGMTAYAIGRKELLMAGSMQTDISRYEGIHVLCSRTGTILTVYRNFNLRGLRPRRRSRSYRYLMPRINRRNGNSNL